jgi:N4-(beta-N-acetylglucosaminyl)-L-asparaginase
MSDSHRFDAHAPSALDRRRFLEGGVAAAALGCATPAIEARQAGVAERTSGAPAAARRDFPVLVGSANALAGMRKVWEEFRRGLRPLDAVIEVVKVVEADPNDQSVGLGGLPNEAGVVQLDAACMDGSSHKSGAVACIENILHPSEVARAVLERTDHCLLVGQGAYAFARAHGHPHVDLLTEASRRAWLEWKESHSDRDDWLPAPPTGGARGAALETGSAPTDLAHGRSRRPARPTGTVHCSALSTRGEIACTTTTSGLAFKIPGRVGDSPIVGAGLYCDAEAGSAGATGRGEASILSNASFACVELLRAGLAPEAAGLEVLRRVVRQVQRLSARQPELADAGGQPNFGLHLYVLGLDGRFAGVTLRGGGQFAVADSTGGPRLMELVPLLG